MADRRKEFEEKAEMLKNEKNSIDEKDSEMKERTDNGSSVQSDRRVEISQKTQELSQIQAQIEEKNNEITQNSNSIQSQTQRNVVDKNRVREFTEVLNKYKDGKKNLDERIKNNEDWWKLRHYGNMPTKAGTSASKDVSQKDDGRPKSVTAWTVNSIINKHADYMDNYPEASCLPVEEQDKEYAQILSSVFPSLYERINHEQTYSDEMWTKLIAGTSVECHFWDNNLQNGLGDINIKEVSVLNQFWEPGVSDIQDSEYYFNVQLMSNNKIRNMFPNIPELKDLSSPTIDVTKYNYDDNVDTSDHSLIIDVYYHKINDNGKSVLHYCKYVNDIVLFASENHEEYDENGYYKHGKYPFVFDTLFPVKGSPCGFGYIDIVKEVQKDIDELNDDFMHNAKASSRKRYIVNTASAVNEEELTDVNNEIIHAAGSGLDEGNFKELVTDSLNGIYLNLYEERINEIKEVSNNRDVSSGGVASGVTAASAIAAMQEAGSKTSRDQEASSYRAFKKGCYLDIELMGQFYEETRYFRIVGETGEQQFVGLNNKGIKETAVINSDGSETSRKAIFDIKVKPQKKSQYSKISQNELMKELYAAGIFNPQNATQASMMVQFMDFEGRDLLLTKITNNGTLYQMLQQYQQIVLAMAQQLDMLIGSQYTMQVQQAIENNQIPNISFSNSITSRKSTNINANATNGNSIVDNSREQTRQRSEVR